MAMAGNIDSALQVTTGCNGSEGYLKEKTLLLISETENILRKQKTLHEGGERMLQYMDINHNYYCMNVPFLITKVQHVTNEYNMSAILDSQCFKAKKYGRKHFEDFSFWGVHIPQDDVKAAFEQAVQSMHVGSKSMYYLKLREQFANSPAFKNEESRYGNFRFSFALCDLLALYKTQHCGEKKPQFKYLGTELFKKEIAHYIVIHSPDSQQFNDFQQVPEAKYDQSLYHVYWRGEHLYWRPESTSEELNVLFSSNGLLDVKKYCVWNNLIFAFHLPEGRSLQIPGETLVKSLSACHATEKPYLGGTKTTRERATQIIESKKKIYRYV